MSKQRRTQAQKPRRSNLHYVKGMQELRRGSRTSPVPSGAEFKRRPKHVKQGWSED